METDELIRNHLPLVESIARRYLGRGEPLDDLRQCGAIGLVLAAQRWDSSRGVSFGAYAAPLVTGEIRRHLRDHGRLVRLPRRVWESAGRCRAAIHELTDTLGRPPTTAEIATRVGLEPEQVIEALAASAWPAPLNEASPVADPAPAPAPALNVIRLLRPGQQRLLELVAIDHRSQRQIATLLGISQAQVSRALAVTIQDVRRLVEGQESPASARVLAG